MRYVNDGSTQRECHKRVCVCARLASLQGFSHLYSHSSDARFLFPHCHSLSCFEWQDKYYVVWALAPPMTIQWHWAKVSHAVSDHDHDDWRGGWGAEAWELYFMVWFLPLCFLYDLVLWLGCLPPQCPLCYSINLKVKIFIYDLKLLLSRFLC